MAVEHNIIRYCGDFTHLFAILLLLVKTLWSRPIVGISGRSQFLLALVFVTRYFDLWYCHHVVSVYHEVFKITFILGTIVTTVLVYCFGKKYPRSFDSLQLWILIVPIGFTCVYCRTFTVLEVLWTLSLFLEAVAMWPQFYMIYQMKQVQKVVFFYLLLVLTYRCFYIANWIYRYVAEDYFDPISLRAGIMQVLWYFIFGVICFFSKVKITNKEDTWFAHNITNGQNDIFVISVPKLENDSKKKSQDGIPLITDEKIGG